MSKVKGKYDEDITDLPLLTDLVTVEPARTKCDVCGKFNETIIDTSYTRYREQKGDVWETNHAYDYSKATLEPSKDHMICDKVRSLEKAVPTIMSSIDHVMREVDRARYASLSMLLRNYVGAWLHRLGERVQR